jgi:CYTH domain-containing protein
VPEWDVADGFDAVERGLERTYRDARDAMDDARKHATDEALHEWRKHAKYQWYQVRLLVRTAPTTLEPLADQLAALADALGDDHDLSVLVESLEREPTAFGGREPAAAAAGLARHHQDDLRERAFRVGARVWAEEPDAYARRLRAYRRADRKLGRELEVGGLADLATDDRPDAKRELVERERKWLVRGAPEDIGEGTRLRQGYLTTGTVAVRIREADGDECTLNIKSGSGAVRTELEWPLDAAEFEALWHLTGDRRIEKMRHRIELDGGRVAELDVFAGELEGFDLVEVEFDDEVSMAEFQPPDWFGREVTDDDRYGNASLALHGAPQESLAAEAAAS